MVKTFLLDQKKYEETIKRLEKRGEKEKRKSQKSERIRLISSKKKEKLEAIRVEVELWNKKAKKQARTNRWIENSKDKIRMATQSEKESNIRKIIKIIV